MRYLPAFLLLLAACDASVGSPPPSAVCQPGKSYPCWCDREGGNGLQVCSADGLFYAACSCAPAGQDAGPPDWCDGGSGCTADHACHPGVALGYCGSSGNACTACPQGQRCEGGACVAGP